MSKIPRFLGLDHKQLTTKFRHIQDFQEQLLVDSEHDPAHPQHVSIGYQPSNLDKNRYSDIFPYDASRVILQPLSLSRVPPHPNMVVIETVDDDEDDDRTYINASHIEIDGRHYIAAQGPLRNTVGDFWRMCWEQHVGVIVMLTAVVERGRKKCHEYWPAQQPWHLVRESLVVTPHTTKQVVVSGLHVAIRTFIIEQGELKKEVVQIHVVDWPDHGVPQEASVLIDLIQLARSHAVRLGGPMVVHCSAGVGRTGTFCVADSLMARLEHQPEVGEEDMVYNQVLALRQKRIIMVQTFVQYVYCYQVLKEWLMKQ